MLRAEADDDIAELSQIHGRGTEKSGDESVGGIVIDFGGSAELAHDALIEHHDAVAHGHGFDLIVRDVDGGGADATVKALELLARGSAELGVEVGERFVKEEDGRLAHDGAGQSHTLPLTAGQFARLAVEERADAEEGRGPLDFGLVKLLLYVLSLQRKCNVFVHREVRIKRIALENHGDAALTWGKIVDHAAADEDFAGRGRFESGDHTQKRGLPGAGRPQEDQKLALASFQIHIVNSSEFSFFEYFCQIARDNDSHRVPVLLFPSGKNTLVLLFGSLGGVFRSFIAARDFSEHGGDNPRFESLVDGGGAVTGIADVGGPIEDVAEDLVLIRGISPRIVGYFLLQIGNSAREAREIVELAGGKAVVERVDVIDEELLRAVFVLGKFPDDVAIHDVLGGNAAHRTLERA